MVFIELISEKDVILPKVEILLSFIKFRKSGFDILHINKSSLVFRLNEEMIKKFDINTKHDIEPISGNMKFIMFFTT